MENSKIEWTTHTFNPWVGCTKVSDACTNCYAEAWAKRAGSPELWAGERRRTSKANWKQPLKWNREAATTGVRPRVFCASLADVFDNAVDRQWRADLFDLIHDTPQLDWLLLTKRIGNAHDMIAEAVASDARPWPWPNVWLGATVVNQEEADRDVPKLLATPARVRFLSMEPLLGPVNLRAVPYMRGSALFIGDEGGAEYAGAHRGLLSWVIVGGESGAHARPMNPRWVLSLRDQCAAAHVPFFFKQWGEWAPDCLCATLEAHATIDRPLPGSRGFMFRCGKKNAGRRINGTIHGEFPHAP